MGVAIQSCPGRQRNPVGVMTDRARHPVLSVGRVERRGVVFGKSRTGGHDTAAVVTAEQAEVGTQRALSDIIGSLEQHGVL